MYFSALFLSRDVVHFKLNKRGKFQFCVGTISFYSFSDYVKCKATYLFIRSLVIFLL